MNASFSQLTLLSFYQWLDHRLCQDQQAYVNNTSQFFYQPDNRLPAGYVAYASPFKSFVWDSGVSGAFILNTVSGSAGTINRGTGMIVDFVNGRVLLDSSVGTNATISGAYAFKDFNLYFANQSQERMVFSNKYYLNSRFARPATGVTPPYDMVTPCIFITNAHSTNKQWALGGLYNTTYTMSLNVMAETMPQLEAALQVLVDSKDAAFPLLSRDLWPLGFYGDYKSGYNYTAYQAQYGNPSNLFMITDVQAAKVADYAKIDESVFLAVVDLTVDRVRTIR